VVDILVTLEDVQLQAHAGRPRGRPVVAPLAERQGGVCREGLIGRFGPFPADSVVGSDNELYTHFIPRVGDFSRFQGTRNGLNKPNRTPDDPHGAGS
jgi:hypothetical protein